MNDFLGVYDPEASQEIEQEYYYEDPHQTEAEFSAELADEFGLEEPVYT